MKSKAPLSGALQKIDVSEKTGESPLNAAIANTGWRLYIRAHMPLPKPRKPTPSRVHVESSAEQHALQNKAVIEAILETAVDAIITIDEKGTVLSFNQAAIRMFGYSSAEVVGHNVSMLMPSPYRDYHDEYLRRYLRTKQARIIGIGREVIGLKKDGSTMPIDLAVSEVKGPEKHIFVGIIRDISEQKYLEKALVMASENERREIGRDLHDALGQIITGISLLAKSLAKKLQTNNDLLSEEAESIALLSMDAMTETKRLAYGAFPTELERQGLKTALLQILENTRHLHKIETHFSAPSAWRPLENSTELHLYRIAQESVANAIKHGRPKNIHLTLERAAGNVTLTILDDGSGIPAKRDPNRISMGLDIMRHRASLINGTLTIRRAKGSGTEVICCISDSILVSKSLENS